MPRKYTRRDGLGVLAGGVLAAGLGATRGRVIAADGGAGVGNSRGLLVRGTEVPVRWTRNRLVVEVEGSLFADGSERSENGVPVRGKSSLEFAEAAFLETGRFWGGGRTYAEAEAENWAGGTKRALHLRTACRTTGLVREGDLWAEFSLSEPLTVSEVELLQTPILAPQVDLLLPITPAKPDSSWRLSEEEVGALLNLEAVYRTDVTVRIAKAEPEGVVLDITGKVDGTGNGVPTEISLQGKARAVLGEKDAYVSWVDLKTSERREVSAIEPGFAIAARTRLLREEVSPQAVEGALADPAALRRRLSSADPARWLVRIHSEEARFECLAGRSWRVDMDTREQCVLRKVENNEVIAQCDIGPMPALESGTQLTLEGFQADIHRALADSLQQFVLAEEKRTAEGLRLLRCVVDGLIEDVPIQWVYCHLSDDSGRRMLLVFTMGGNVTDRFAGSDEQITSSFRFLS